MWGEVLKTAAYLSNRSPGPDELTPYEIVKGSKPNLSHLRVIGARAWVQVPKEKRTKLDERSWQGIFMGYEPTSENQFRIYDPRKNRMAVVRDVVVDKTNTYERGSEPLDYWTHEDDQFIDPNDNESDEPTWKKPAPIAPRLHQTVGDTVRDTVRDTIDDRVDNVSESEDDLAHSVGDQPIMPGNFEDDVPTPQPRRSERVRQAPKLPAGMMSYDSSQRTLPHATVTVAEGEKFSYTGVHKHMVRILATLKMGGGTGGPDEPATLKEAMKRSDWPKWKEAMDREYASLIKNKTWNLVQKSASTNVITGRWAYKLKKDRDGNILRYKAR